MNDLKQLVNSKHQEKFTQKIVNKEFLLGKFFNASLSSNFRNTRHRCPLKKFPKTARKKMLDNQLQIRQKIDPQQILPISYQLFEPLNKMWTNYMLDLISNENNQEVREMKVLRSDFHGASICVMGSKNCNYIGLSGIVIKETLRTFEIVLKRQQEQKKGKHSVVILKSICVFLVSVQNLYSFIINGNHLVYRPSDRMKHKFKFKKAEVVNHEFLGVIEEADHQIANEECC